MHIYIYIHIKFTYMNQSGVANTHWRYIPAIAEETSGLRLFYSDNLRVHGGAKHASGRVGPRRVPSTCVLPHLPKAKLLTFWSPLFWSIAHGPKRLTLYFWVLWATELRVACVAFFSGCVPCGKKRSAHGFAGKSRLGREAEGQAYQIEPRRVLYPIRPRRWTFRSWGGFPTSP